MKQNRLHDFLLLLLHKNFQEYQFSRKKFSNITYFLQYKIVMPKIVFFMFRKGVLMLHNK